MSNATYIGRQMRSFASAPQFDGYTRVIINVSENIQYSAGTDTGRTLTVDNPWGTQKMANAILARIKGFQYQPYTATDTILDPAAELGDGITANDVYSGIYTRDIKFGPLFTATVSAPEEEELDHEYPYVSKQNREIKRQFANVSAQFVVQDDRISAEVKNRISAVAELSAALDVQADRITAEVTDRKADYETLNSKLTIQADEISAKVSKTGGDASSFAWNLGASSWTIKANGTNILKATKSGLEIYGKITATSGKIGGLTIKANALSYNGQTWGGTNAKGIYLGPNGIQFGKNFRVDVAGNLTAKSGTFTGYIKANRIQYGGDDGYFSGSGLTPGSVTGGSGGAIGSGSVGTFNLTGGINTSLGYADAAYLVTSGQSVAANLFAGTMRISNYLYFAQRQVYMGSIPDKDGTYRNVLMWK